METNGSDGVVFDLDGGTCASCAYALEHLGRKLAGVRDVRVDVNESTLEVDCAGEVNEQVIAAMTEIVRRIGYRAALRPG